MKITRQSDTIFKKSDHDFLDEDEWKQALQERLSDPTQTYVESTLLKDHPDIDEALRRGWQHHRSPGIRDLVRGSGDRFETLHFGPLANSWKHTLRGEGPIYYKFYPTLSDAVRGADNKRGYKQYSEDPDPVDGQSVSDRQDSLLKTIEHYPRGQMGGENERLAGLFLL